MKPANELYAEVFKAAEKEELLHMCQLLYRIIGSVKISPQKSSTFALVNQFECVFYRVVERHNIQPNEGE